MPAEGEEPLGLHRLDPEGHRHVLEAPEGELPADLGAGREHPGQRRAEPGVELPDVGERPPDPRARDVEVHHLFDAVGRNPARHMRPHSETEGSLSGWRSSSTSRSMRVSQRRS
jgi:hypothetical protein